LTIPFNKFQIYQDDSTEWDLLKTCALAGIRNDRIKKMHEHPGRVE